MNTPVPGGEYVDIIGLPHHTSARHPQMSMLNRAAQFSPFAALSGHEAMIEETARVTERRHGPDEEAARQLNAMLQRLCRLESRHPRVAV